MRTVFKDPELQARFERDGFVVRPFLTPGQVRDLSDEYGRLPEPMNVNRRDAFASSLHAHSFEHKQAVYDVLARAARAACDPLSRYEALVRGFVTKRPGPDGAVPPHQDWTFVDERNLTSLNVWCPLTDVDDRNGALHLLRGGHKVPFSIRGTLTPNPFRSVTILGLSAFTCISMRAGDMLLYDHRLIHASLPNSGDTERVAISFTVVPEEAQTVHYFQNPTSGRLECYAAGHCFYLAYSYGQNTMPPDTDLLFSLAPGDDLPREFTDDDVAPLIHRT